MNTQVKNTKTKKVVKNVVNEKAILKAVTKKANSNGLHKALLECNKLDKIENYSLSGALKRLKIQIDVNDTYKGIDTNLIVEALTFDNLLKNVNTKCIDKQRFTVYALGLAVNKFLKPFVK